MRQRYIVTVVIGLCLALQGFSWAVEEGLADLRGDLQRIEAGQQNIQKQVDDVRKQLDDTRRGLEGQIADVRKGLEGQIADVRKGLEGQIADVRKGLEGQIVETRRELKDFMLWGFGVTFAGMFALIGFVIWDRRSALAPAVVRLRELADHEARVERALKEMAQRDPNVAEALRHVGLL
jgi:hypothetical protein